jgi:hypothetical protein
MVDILRVVLTSEFPKGGEGLEGVFGKGGEVHGQRFHVFKICPWNLTFLYKMISIQINLICQFYRVVRVKIYFLNKPNFLVQFLPSLLLLIFPKRIIFRLTHRI